MEDFFTKSNQEHTSLEEGKEGKKKLKPLLKKLTEIRPPKIDYLGVSYGLTKELYGFWKKNGYLPVYLR